MSDADKAFAEAERMIAMARTMRADWLSLDRKETHALERLPEGIVDLSALRVLDLDHTRVSEIGLLARVNHLTGLSFIASRVSDLSPLSSLKKLSVLALNNTRVSDLHPLSSLTSLTELRLDNTQVLDLRPIQGLRNLEETPDYFGLTFKGCLATRADPRIAEISKIKSNSERARVLFDYLEDWVPPLEKGSSKAKAQSGFGFDFGNDFGGMPQDALPQAPNQIPAPLKAGWQGDRLVELPVTAELDGSDAALAEEGWQALHDFFADVRDTLRKDNLPNLTRAIDAFGRALGNSYADMRPIAVGTHGQRIIEISRSSDAMLLEDAEGDLRAFAALIDTMVSRFDSWVQYKAGAVRLETMPPVAEVLPEFREFSRVFDDVDVITPELAQKFDDLVEMTENADVPGPLAILGVVTSLSNILSPLAAKAIAGVTKVGKDFATEAYKKTMTGTVLACGDLFLNKGQIMLTLAQKFPDYLGWLASVVRLFH